MDPRENYLGMNEESFFDKVKAHIIDFIQTLVVFGAIFALIYLFVAQPHQVSGRSMVPTFQNGDYILTDKISYRLGEPKKQDVIVLKSPKDESKDFIKRILALPNDRIKIQANSIYVNGEKITEPYIPEDYLTEGKSFLNDGEEVTMDDNHYFVIGDNRENSSDSREWGPITREEIVGKVFFRYWPPKSFGFFKNL